MKAQQKLSLGNCNKFAWIELQLNAQFAWIQLYCLSVEKFDFWLIIYIKTFNKINNKTSTTQLNMELKTTQIQGKYLTMYTHTRMHAHTESELYANITASFFSFSFFSEGMRYFYLIEYKLSC